MYFIQWASTGKTKWVKRLNLLFANESKSGFSFRCVTGAMRSCYTIAVRCTVFSMSQPHAVASSAVACRLRQARRRREEVSWWLFELLFHSHTVRMFALAYVPPHY